MFDIALDFVPYSIPFSQQAFIESLASRYIKTPYTQISIQCIQPLQLQFNLMDQINLMDQTSSKSKFSQIFQLILGKEVLQDYKVVHCECEICCEKNIKIDKLSLQEYKEEQELEQGKFFDVEPENYFNIENQDDYIYYAVQCAMLFDVQRQIFKVYPYLNSKVQNYIKSYRPEKLLFYRTKKLEIHNYSPNLLKQMSEAILVEKFQLSKPNGSIMLYSKQGQIVFALTFANISKNSQKIVRILQVKLKKITKVSIIQTNHQNTINIELYTLVKKIVKNTILVKIFSSFKVTTQISNTRDSFKFRLPTSKYHLQCFIYNDYVVVLQGNIQFSKFKSILRRIDKIVEVDKKVKYLLNSNRYFIQETIFENELCFSIYTFYYNFYVKYYNYEGKDAKDIHEDIVRVFLKARQAKKQISVTNQDYKDLHFPLQIQKHCKVCVVHLYQRQSNCVQIIKNENLNDLSNYAQGQLQISSELNNLQHKLIKQKGEASQSIYDQVSISSNSKGKQNEVKFKKTLCKTKYKCAACSVEFKKDIPLCVTCFKQFHQNISYYVQKMAAKYKISLDHYPLELLISNEELQIREAAVMKTINQIIAQSDQLMKRGFHTFFPPKQ